MGHLFEAILLGVVVIAAVMLVEDLSARPDTHDTDRTWDKLKQANEDALAAWDTLPPYDPERRRADRELGRTLLERLLRERFTDAATGREGWEKLRGIYFRDNPGLSLRLEYELQGTWTTLYGERYADPTGENVGIMRLVFPDWGGVYAHPKAAPADGASRVSFEAAVVNKSRLVRQPGDAVRFAVRYGGIVGEEGAGVEVSSYGLVAQRAAAAPTGNLRWETLANQPVSAQMHRALLISEAGDFREFRLNVTAEKHTIPAGFEVHIRLDSGFASAAIDTAGHWSEGSAPVVRGPGIEFTARHDAPLQNGTSITLRFWATPLPTLDAFGLVDPNSAMPPEDVTRVHAWLGNGTLSRTTAIVRFLYVDPDATSPPQLFPTVPYALQAGATARIGAVFQNGPEDITVNEFLIEMPGGYDLLHHDGEGAPLFNNDTSAGLRGIEPVAPLVLECGPGVVGWDVASERLVRWCGRLDLEAHEAATFVVEVPINATPPSMHPRTKRGLSGTWFDTDLHDYWSARLRFEANGFEALPVEGPGAWRTAPGVYRFRVAPASAGAASDDGYPNLAGGGGVAGSKNYFHAILDRARNSIEGPSGNGASYRLSAAAPALSDLEGAVLNSSLEVEPRVALPGNSVALDVDFRAVMRELDSLDNPVVDLVHRVEVFVPASLPGKPFLAFEETLEGALRSPLLDLEGANVVSAGDDEILVASGDGRVYAVSAASGTITPSMGPHWNEVVSQGVGSSALTVLAGDVDPLTPGKEVASIADDGTVMLASAATGIAKWRTNVGSVGRAVAHDPEARGVVGGAAADVGRVYALETTTDLLGDAVTTLHLLAPNDGTSDATYALPLGDGDDAGAVVVPFQSSADPDDRAALVAIPDGNVMVVSSSGDELWTSTGGFAGSVLAAGAGDFAELGGDGEEVVVAWGEGVAVFDAAGNVVASWTESAATPGRAASVGGSVLGTSAPEVAFAGNDKAIYLLDLDRDPAPSGDEARVWKLPGISMDELPHDKHDRELHEALEEPSVIRAGECAYDDTGLQETLFHDVCNVDWGSSVAGADDAVVTPTVIRLMHDASGRSAHDVVMFGAVTATKGHIVGVNADTGELAWDPWVIHGDVEFEPTAFAPVTRRTPLGADTTPAIAAGTKGGELFLFNWTTGDSDWTYHVAPGAAPGEFTYYVPLPDNALPGSYVVTATLTWKQVVGSTGVTQSARAMNWFEVLFADGVPVEEPFSLTLTLRAWQGWWDRAGDEEE